MLMEIALIGGYVMTVEENGMTDPPSGQRGCQGKAFRSRNKNGGNNPLSR